MIRKLTIYFLAFQKQTIYFTSTHVTHHFLDQENTTVVFLRCDCVICLAVCFLCLIQATEAGKLK